MASILDFAAAKAAKEAKKTFDIPGLCSVTTEEDVEGWLAQLQDLIELTYDEKIIIGGPEMDRMIDKIRDVIMEAFNYPESTGDLIA